MDGSYWVIHTSAGGGLGGGDLGPGVVTMPVVKEGTEEGQKTMSHFSNELNIPSECLLVSQM